MQSCPGPLPEEAAALVALQACAEHILGAQRIQGVT